MAVGCAGKGTWLQARYLVAFSASLLNAVFYAMRINLSVTIVAIAIDTEHQDNSPVGACACLFVVTHTRVRTCRSTTTGRRSSAAWC